MDDVTKLTDDQLIRRAARLARTRAASRTAEGAALARELQTRFGPLPGVRRLAKAVGQALVAELAEALARLEKAGP
jgi:hypothetical protein